MFPRSRRSTRLNLEALDGREAPSLLTMSTEVPAELRAKLAGNQAPTISNFKAVVGPEGQVTFSGVVSDDQAVAGYVVHIVGQGVDVSAVVLRDGTFQVTTTVSSPTDVTVVATVTDQAGATSSPVYATFTPSA